MNEVKDYEMKKLEKLVNLMRDFLSAYQRHASLTKNVDSNHISDFLGWANNQLKYYEEDKLK